MSAAGARPAVLTPHAGATGVGPVWPGENEPNNDRDVTREHLETPGGVISAFPGTCTGFWLSGFAWKVL
jgi:hypothetical protein